MYQYYFYCIGGLTQRDESHPGYFRGKFHSLTQNKTITDVKEHYEEKENKFVYVLKFVTSSNMQRHEFKGEGRSKREAMESASKKAVIDLGILHILPKTINQ